MCMVADYWKYCWEMEQPGTWGDHVTLQVCLLLQLRVHFGWRTPQMAGPSLSRVAHLVTGVRCPPKPAEFIIAAGYRRCVWPTPQHPDVLPQLAFHFHFTGDGEVAQMPVPELLG